MATDAEREKIAQEIQELERILDPGSSRAGVELSESSLDLDSDADSLCSEDPDTPGPSISDEERWEEVNNEEEEDPKDRNLPEDPETCLQLNMVYQEVVQEKLTEVNLLLAQNRAQQEEIKCDLAGSKGPKAKSRKGLPHSMYIGHFMKPYFKDKVTGMGPPANEDMREKAAQGVKSFEELLVTKWKSWEKTLLRKSVMSDRLQRLLQPKLLKLEYLEQKQSRVSSETEKQLLEKQIREAEKEVEDIHQLPEEALLGNRLDSHDWEKISNVNFEGGRSAEEIRKFWQNCEHPSINKQEWSREEVEQLKTLSSKHGHLGWQRIADELGTQRSAFQCLQKFQQHNRDLKRREWTEEEDYMLTQLVQEMRVGSHIPYRRIVYYMEGRDSMQLLYRWTKSLDPCLKKGCWTPEEDAKLLQAVAKHGAHDWFKIREEVPGRSDAQCRDRYLRRLHFSLKKGRWNLKEEEKLLELIEKYGAGHWAKIASELPHRTGSQCLSKWKIMVGKKQSYRQRRRRPRRYVRWSSSSEDTEDSEDSKDSDSSSSQDTETELEESPAVRRGSEVPSSASYVVPGMDLWVPTRQSAPALCQGRAQGWLRRLETVAASGGSEEMPVTASVPGVDKCQTSGDHSDVQHPHLTNNQELEEESRTAPHEVALETVRRVLWTNTAAQGRALGSKEQMKPPPGPCPAPQPAIVGSPRPQGQHLWPSSVLSRQHRQRQRHALQRRLLHRRLLMAVGPWVGSITLPRKQAPPRSSAVQTRADIIWKQLPGTPLASTPVFTLLVQLFQIDADGCMQVIRERKAQPPAKPHHLQVKPSLGTRHCSGGLSPAVPTQEAAGPSTGHRGSSGQEPCQFESAGPPAPCGLRPKPKTVSELLREKRLREARAKRTTLGPRTLPLQLLVSSPGVPLPTLQSVPQGLPAAGLTVCNMAFPGLGAPTGAGLGTPIPLVEVQTPAKESRPHTLQAPALPSTGARISTPEGSSQHSDQGHPWAPSTPQKEGLPQLPPLLPAAPSPARLPGLSLVSAPVAANTGMSVTWLLTPQGLLPMSVPAMVALSQPLGTPAPGLSVTLLPSPTETPASPRSQASAPWMPPTPGTAAEASGDSVSTPGQPSSPGAVKGAREPAVSPTVPEKPSQTTLPASQLPETQLPLPGQPLPHSAPGLEQGPVGTADGPSGAEVPLDLEKPPLEKPGPKKGIIDMSLLAPEAAGDTQGWLSAQQGVCVPPLGTRLPYQPPTLCTLRTLSSLLVHKRALEHKAISLVPGETAGSSDRPLAETLQAALGLVHTHLGDSPAYLLLKARFLAAFSLPALLATLPPHGVPTTLSAPTRLDSESEDDPREPEAPDERGHLTSSPPAGPQHSGQPLHAQDTAQPEAEAAVLSRLVELEPKLCPCLSPPVPNQDTQQPLGLVSRSPGGEPAAVHCSQGKGLLGGGVPQGYHSLITTAHMVS
ncbi:snRNA-activating protein complex subunit 4 [Rhynchocyon petersi]